MARISACKKKTPPGENNLGLLTKIVLQHGNLPQKLLSIQPQKRQDFFDTNETIQHASTTGFTKILLQRGSDDEIIQHTPQRHKNSSSPSQRTSAPIIDGD